MLKGTVKRKDGTLFTENWNPSTNQVISSRPGLLNTMTTQLSTDKKKLCKTKGTVKTGLPEHCKHLVCYLFLLQLVGCGSRPCLQLQYKVACVCFSTIIVQELCESRGGRPGLSILTSLLVSMNVKLYWTMFQHLSQLVPNMSTDIQGH